MKHKLTLMGCLFATAVMLTVLMSANAQDATPFPPEATVVPEGAVFSAPGRCIVSPDETQVALPNYAIFSLPDGEKLYEFVEKNLLYSPDGRYFASKGRGLFDAQTGDLLIESSSLEPSFTPDGRFYIEYDKVYALPSLEEVADLLRLGNGLDYRSYIEFENNNQWINYLQENDTASPRVLIDTNTWQPVVDLTTYPVGFYPFFNADYTRYVIDGIGMFTYPDGEKLFDVPVGMPRFSGDSQTVMFTAWDTNGQRTYTFLDNETGQHLNQFAQNRAISAIDTSTELPYIYEIRPYIDENMTRITMPDGAIQTVRGEQHNILTGWRLIEVRTNKLLKQWNATDAQSAWDELGFGFDKYRNAHIVNGLTAVNKVGVFDVATDTIIKPMDGLGGLYLTAGGSYVVSQNPCTVWRLP